MKKARDSQSRIELIKVEAAPFQHQPQWVNEQLLAIKEFFVGLQLYFDWHNQRFEATIDKDMKIRTSDEIFDSPNELYASISNGPDDIWRKLMVRIRPGFDRPASPATYNTRAAKPMPMYTGDGMAPMDLRHWYDQ
jgi:hypothetical protein